MKSAAWCLLGLLGTQAGCSGCQVTNIEEAPGTLKGKVCQQVTGRPSIGAQVTVNAKKSGNPFTLSATSDTLGEFELLNVPPGEIDVTIHGEGVNSLTVTPKLSVKTGATTTWLDPACIDPALLAGKGCVAGQVCNRHTGSLVQDAQVQVILSNVNYSGPPEDLITTTNAQGVFQLCGVPAGSHTVTVRATGFQRAFPATVTQGETTQVTSAPSCTAFDPTQYCVVRGRVCTSETPPGWLPDARVTATLLGADGNPVTPVVHEAQEEYTNADGRYELALAPGGRWRVQVQKGDFISQHEVTCDINSVTQIPEGEQCVSAAQCRFLVASGVYDRVETVLRRVGVLDSRLDVVDGSPADLNDDWAFRSFGGPHSLDGYCGVFFNCGINESSFVGPAQNPVVLQNLRDFVQRGGTVYASDQAYDVVEAMFPGKVDWYRNDDLPSDAEFGLPGDITAQVTDDALRVFLQADHPGQTSVDIRFNYQTWAIIQALDADVQVYLRAAIQACVDGDACLTQVTLPNTPLTIRYPVGQNGGQVIFTSFHTETQETTDGGVGATLSTADTDRVMRFLMTL